jgi:hypothetical protein
MQTFLYSCRRQTSNPHQGYKYEGSNRFWEPRRPFLIMLQDNDRHRDKDKDRERELPASLRNTWMLSNHSCWEASLAKLKRKSFRLRFRMKPPHMVLFEDMQKVYKMMLNSPLLIPITSSCTIKHPCLVVPCHCSTPEYLSVAVTRAPSSCNSSSTSDSISLLLLSSSYPSPFSFFLSSILSDLSLCLLLLLLLIFFAHKDQHRSRKLVVNTTSYGTKLFFYCFPDQSVFESVATKWLTQTEEDILSVSAPANMRSMAENPQQETVQCLEDRNDDNNKQRQHGISPPRSCQPFPPPPPSAWKESKAKIYTKIIDMWKNLDSLETGTFTVSLQLGRKQAQDLH